MGPTFKVHRDADDQPRPHRVDRHPARGPGPAGPGRAHRAATGTARRRSCWPPRTDSRTHGSRLSLGVCEDTVRKWRHRWCAAPGVASLGDAQRSGRPPVFTPVQVAQVKALACTPPAEAGLPLSRWSCPELARQAVSRGDLRVDLGVHGAPLAVRGRPQTLAVPVVDLHHRPRLRRQGRSGCSTCTHRIWDGKPLGDNEYVISADEKTSIQARCRCHPTLPPGQGPHDAGQPRLRPRRRGRLPGRLRRAPRQGLRPLRAHHRHRPVQPPGHTGHDARNPTNPPTGCSGSSTTAPPTADRPRSTGSPSSTRTRSWCTPRCTPPG